MEIMNKYLSLGDHNETTNLVLDHLTFMTNLSEINKEVENLDSGHFYIGNYTVNMTLEYSARNDLGLENMSPMSWWNYVKSMATSSSNGECNKVHRT